MSELGHPDAPRWDFDRYFREQHLGTPFSDGVTFADVDIEIERHGQWLVIEGKRTGDHLSTGQARAMEERVRQGRTCLIVWGDPEIGTVSEIGIYQEYFPGSDRVRLIRLPATLEDVWQFCRSWWNYADAQPWPQTNRSPFHQHKASAA